MGIYSKYDLLGVKMNKIKEFRTKKKISQCDIAKIMNVKQEK